MNSNLTTLLTKATFSGLPYIPNSFSKYILRKTMGTHQLPEAQRFFELGLYQIKRFLKNTNQSYKEKFINNFIINEIIIGNKRRKEVTKELGAEIPAILVISPTMKCPLRCYGCYSGEYDKAPDLTREKFEDVLNQANDMGIYFFVISGGEPFIYPNIHEIFKKYSDSWFQVYTSAITLAKEENVKKLAELGNVMPCISVEGFEEETDKRRGKGHFKNIRKAMANLNKYGIPYGFSATATKENHDIVTSEKFFDFYINEGCYFGYFFQYMPIGRQPAWELVPTPQQRKERWVKINEFRKNKKLLLVDFWNDGPLVGGCIAGGRRYLHITHTGAVEPCVFAQYSMDNIYEKSLKDIIFTSPLFIAIRKNQPYSTNLLRPCMIIDNPETLRKVLEESNAKPSYGAEHAITKEWSDKIDTLSSEWKIVADKIWKDNYQPRYENWTTKSLEMQRKWNEKESVTTSSAVVTPASLSHGNTKQVSNH